MDKIMKNINKGIKNGLDKAGTTPFDQLAPGIWEAKRKGSEGEFDILVKVYGIHPFFEVSVWEYNVSKQGMRADNINVSEISKLEFGEKLKDIGRE